MHESAMRSRIRGAIKTASDAEVATCLAAILDVIRAEDGIRSTSVTPVQSFFFSSRRRHTRYIGDWSSDVCSSDLRRRSGRRCGRRNRLLPCRRAVTWRRSWSDRRIEVRQLHHGFGNFARFERQNSIARSRFAQTDQLSDLQRVPYALLKALVVEDRAVATGVLDPPGVVLEEDPCMPRRHDFAVRSLDDESGGGVAADNGFNVGYR